MKSSNLIASLGLVLIALPALADEPQLDAKREAMLERAKAMESRSHHERMRILQEADRCIQGAKDRQAYHSCEQTERDAREAHREAMRPEREALRAEAQAMHQAMRERRAERMEPRRP